VIKLRRRALLHQINLNSAKQPGRRDDARDRRFDLCRFDHDKTIAAQVGQADDAELFTLRRR
jgi:hypothetical protein